MIAVMVLPIFFDLDGIWASVTLAELAGMVIKKIRGEKWIGYLIY